MGALLQVLLGTIVTASGTIELYRDEALCLPPARGAQWVPVGAGVKVPGCWSTNGEVVFVSWFDSDISRVPVGAIKKADPL